MCSATQKGFLVRRSKEEMRELRVARSATGPGKPYWKSPAGSTGEVRAVAPGKGMGAGRVLEGEGEGGVDSRVGVGCFFLSVGVARDMLAAVTAAPVAALTAAMIANVVFDILKEEEREGGVLDIYEMREKARQSRSQESQVDSCCCVVGRGEGWPQQARAGSAYFLMVVEAQAGVAGDQSQGRRVRTKGLVQGR